MTDTLTLHGVVADHVAAVNAFDEDAIVVTFADDALVNDARREFPPPRPPAGSRGQPRAGHGPAAGGGARAGPSSP